MSLRNIRKIYGNTTLPPPEGNSDEEYEPLYVKNSQSKFKYQGLILSSHSESEHESTDTMVLENATTEEQTKKKRKKKKKSRKVKPIPTTSKMDDIELDEIDKSVMEVNAILGAPPAVIVCTEVPVEPVRDLFLIEQKHLNVANELNKLFGPEPLEEGQKRRARQSNLNRLTRKAVIVPIPDNTINFHKFGLSMSMLKREEDVTYFTFDHSKVYQRVHRSFIDVIYYSNVALPIDESQKHMHVEGLLEGADSMFQIEEFSAANTIIEQIIAFMQSVAHPSFNLTNGKTRLEYKYMENRPFHIAVLKYLYLLTNRACHRTALELAKLLLKLDPSDPLAVLFVIDTVALRAREHQWLIDAVDYWSKERDAGFLFNIKYSYAMAYFHVATKSKGDLSHADQLLQNAMMRFPTVVMKIFECASVTPSALLRSHDLFGPAADETASKNLKDLTYLYAKLSCSKWREPAVMGWLTRNANELAEKYNNDLNLQERIKEFTNERHNLFQGWPKQIVRHLSIIKPMSSLLVDGAVPHVSRSRSFDPAPPADTINRYGYGRDRTAPTPTRNSTLYELFSSILPRYYIPMLPEFERHLMERRLEAAELNAILDGHNVANVNHDVAALENEDGALGQLDAAEGGQPRNFVASMEILTNAFRRFLDIYERGNVAEEVDGNRRPPEQDQDRRNED